MAKQEETEVRKTKSRTLLTTKKDVRPSSKAGVKLDKLPDRTIFGKTIPPDLTDDLPQLKTVKLTKAEQ